MILIVENEAVSACYLHRLLQKALPERQQLSKRTLNEAQEALVCYPVSVVIADANLPDSTGVHTARRLSRLAGKTPVIVFTATDIPDEDFIAAGAVAVLRKGKVPTQTLKAIVTAALEKGSQAVGTA